MSTQIHQCEKAVFPFKAKSSEWQGLCLSVQVDEKVRVVRREPAEACAHTPQSAYEWCVAQSEDGVLGLLPSLVLQRAAEGESFTLTPCTSPNKEKVGSAAPTGCDPLATHVRSRRASAASRHFDPFALDLSSDECDKAAEKRRDDREDGSTALPHVRGDPAGRRRTTARPSELPDTHAPGHGSQVIVSSSTTTSGESATDSDDDSVCSFERCPGTLAVHSAPLRITRRPMRVSAAEAAAARRKAVAAAKKQSTATPLLEKKATAAATTTTANTMNTKEKKKQAEADAQRCELLEAWQSMEAERAWMVSETLPAIERAIVQAETESAAVEKEAARKAALVEKRQAAAAVQDDELRALAAEAQSLLDALNAGTRKNSEAEAEANTNASGSASTTRTAGIGRRLFNEVDPNTATSVASGLSSTDKSLLDLVQQETETLASYAAQEVKLRTRLARATSLLATLHDESALLSASEDALGALLLEGVDYEVEPVEEGQVRKDVPPVRVVMRDAERMKGFAWPRSLPGLTEEEQAALDNYVRLADKYAAKHKQESGRFGDLLDVDDLEAGHDDGAGTAALHVPQQHRVAKLRATIADGDAEVAKLRDDMAKLREFVTTYEPVAERIEEQMAIGTRVLKQKEADLAKLQQKKATGVRL